MYNLPYFKDNDPSRIMDFIRGNPFAFIAGCNGNGEPVATQIPVFIEERNGKLFLTGHIMRNTDHHRAFETNASVLCVFTGPHTYVSASWYKDPHQASTWNYMAVHVRGRINFLDQEGLIRVLQQTTLHFENHDPHSPTVFDNLHPAYTERLMKAIIAFEVEVTSMDHVFKLSQNRDQESYGNIISRLEGEENGGRQIAGEMKKRKDELFG